MARKSQPVSPPEDAFTEEQELLPPAGGAADNTSTANEINIKVQRVEEQLLDLKRQQEEIERQKKELDELSRKQREFDEGRRDIVEKLTRGLVLLEREEFEVKRELEQIKIVRDSFAEHLGQTENLNPAEWSSEELPTELTKALARVDQAKAIYSQSRARLTALRQSEEAQGIEDNSPSDLIPESSSYVPAEKTIGAMMKEGFFYSFIPLGLISIFLLASYIFLHAH
jgi:predicted RNase H-like nuclease (RuvC/YqgF family)